LGLDKKKYLHGVTFTLSGMPGLNKR
jgi:hypothetical protein